LRRFHLKTYWTANYILDGRQYVLIESGSAIMAFALPEK
jgi:hypothetical protein